MFPWLDPAIKYSGVKEKYFEFEVLLKIADDTAGEG